MAGGGGAGGAGTVGSGWSKGLGVTGAPPSEPAVPFRGSVEPLLEDS